MSITALDYASPFFPVSYVQGEEEYAVREKSIVFNMSDEDLFINGRPLGFFRSTVAVNTVITARRARAHYREIRCVSRRRRRFSSR